MVHKRAFGRRGFAAVLMPASAARDTELMGRVDAAGVQFGISHEYAYTFFKCRNYEQSSAGYRELIELAGRILLEKFEAIITVGPEAASALREVMGRRVLAPMVIGVNTQEALDANQPHQFDMINMMPRFLPNVSPLVKVCLEKGLTQEQGLEHLKKQEALRERRSNGIFDDCYVILLGKSGARHMVRFEDHEDAILPPTPEHPFLGRDRVILFKA